MSTAQPQFSPHLSSKVLPELGRALFGVLLALVIAGIAFVLHLNLSSAGSLEFLLVVIVALRRGFAQATVVSLVSLACLNYLFTEPLFTFAVADSKNLVALATFEATALLVSRSSSQVRIHAAEVEQERKRNSKLYELSRAILLVDVRESTASQLEALIRELIDVERVEIWAADDLDGSSAARVQPQTGSTYESYASGTDSDDLANRTTRRVLRSGTTSIGAVTLQGWRCDAPLADAIASLIAIALERARAIRKENQAEAERNTEQLRTAVLDGLAHGYKTPLTSIQTASSGLLAISQMTPTQTELVTIIDDQVTLLSKLTTRLLQTAALEGKEVKLRRRRVELIALIDDVLDQQERSIRDRVRVRAPEIPRPEYVDAELLQLALTQLVDNAAKYSIVGPMIEIAVHQDAQATTLTVANEGSPIAKDEQERIFRRFYRGVDAAKGPTGTGLGLSIVKKAAEAHGGRAWAECEGGMNRFSMSIPHYKEAASE